MEAQRDERLHGLLGDLGRPVRRALDLGCGRGEALGTLDLSGVGVDRSIVRLQLAPGRVVCADAMRLPFPAASFDLVLLLNVVSSIPVDDDRRLVAEEVARVLTPDGVVLWYDQRWPNPGNRETKPVGQRELAALFPGGAVAVEPVTVVPALARAFPRSYERLHRLPVLRSHLIGAVRPRQESAR